MDLGLAGNGALFTGGSRGDGRAIATSLLREGARVMISVRNAARWAGVFEQKWNGCVRCLRHALLAMQARQGSVVILSGLASSRASFVTGAAWHVDGGACSSI